MREITTVKTVFTYDELSDKAKEKARDWFRESNCDYEWFEYVYEDADNIAKILGIELDRKRGNTPDIMFSGFYSQGDGACFEASYSYAKGAVKAVKDYAPNDTELQRIAKLLQDTQRRNFYRLTATTKQRGHYYHSGCMSVSVEDSENQYRDIGDSEDDITQAMRDFADWIYKRLENEYEHLNSDETVESNIIANEYEFDEEGNI